jgi:hypothetical protein
MMMMTQSKRKWNRRKGIGREDDGIDHTFGGMRMDDGAGGGGGDDSIFGCWLDGRRRMGM